MMATVKGKKNLALPKLLTVPEVCEKLRVTKWTVYEMVHDGRLKAFKQGNRLRFERSEIKRYLAHKSQYQHNLQRPSYETAPILTNRLELHDILKTIVTRAAALVGATHGHIWLVEKETNQMIMIVGIGTSEDFVGYRVPFGKGLIGTVWKTGQPVVVDNYQTWPDRLLEPRFDVYCAMAAVPLKSGVEVIGVIGLGNLEEGRGFKNKEITILSQFADLASIALNSTRLYTQAKQELSVLENVIEGISQLDQEGFYISVNKAYASMLGYQPDELINKSWRVTVHLEDLQKALNAYNYMMSHGKAEFEARALRKDGSTFYKRVTMIKTYDQQNRFKGHYCFMKDLTESKQVEKEL
jgi:PAS domain S-box-containing protein/excisionase family DNA binding protein